MNLFKIIILPTIPFLKTEYFRYNHRKAILKGSMMALTLIRIVLGLTLTTHLQAAEEDFIDITGGIEDQIPIPPAHQSELSLAFSNLGNTGLTERQTTAIQNYLNLPYWADSKEVITLGETLKKGLPKKERTLLIQGMIQQKIDQFEENRVTKMLGELHRQNKCCK